MCVCIFNALQRKCTGEQLLNKVVEKLELVQERDFFGLTYGQGHDKVMNCCNSLID